MLRNKRPAANRQPLHMSLPLSTNARKRLLLCLLLLQLALVEFQFLAFQNVTISTAALARARADASQQTASGELFVQLLVQFHLALHLGELTLQVAGALDCLLLWGLEIQISEQK